jgi:Signal transduction histidine kinase
MITELKKNTNTNLSKSFSKENYEFVSNMVHELKTPLTSILGFIEFLKKDSEKDKQTREYFYDIIDSEAQRLLRLIDDFLVLAQIETSEYVKLPQKCNIKKELDTVLKILLPSAKLKNIDFYIDIDKNLYIYASSLRLQQLFSNLVNNAIKYNVSGGKISIHAYSDKSNIIVSVKDTGIGIEPENIDKIFDRFYRVNTEETSEIPGNGLGLSIVKDIVALYNGTIKINSKVGQGSEFIVSFPCA